MTFETEREADFGTRLLAALIDGLVVGLLYGLITEIFLLVTIATDPTTTMGAIPGLILLSVWGSVGYFAEGFFDGILVAFAPSQLFSMSMVWLTVGLIAVNWLYHAIMESSASQATLGKKVMHVRVTTMNGERISFVRATARHFLKTLSSLLLLVGFFLPMISERKQTLHDKLSGCLVKQEVVPQPIR